MKKITTDEINLISKYIYDISGIYIDQKKTYLIESRLSSIAEALNCTSYIEFYCKAKSDPTLRIKNMIINAITTHETFFFRDSQLFEMMADKILPDLIDRKAADSSKFLPLNIRIWSAACSTGQEVYSIAIVLKEVVSNINKFNIRILGTDISDKAIVQASAGEYNKFEIERGLSDRRLNRYFNFNGQVWKIEDEIRSMVTFKKHNLLDPFDKMDKFDIVFCRNAAIYFNMKDRISLFNKIADILEPGGYLIIGSSEHLIGIGSRFESKKYLKSVCYQLRV
ncbi:MAG: protein-glutamate O-methyltransferase CheR [Desulfobacterales bacterium]|nr:protein-glutamate O-methyltransferase CheR [Desulfobacterales bacterium]